MLQDLSKNDLMLVIAMFLIMMCIFTFWYVEKTEQSILLPTIEVNELNELLTSTDK